MNNEQLQQLVCRISLESFRKPFNHQAYFNKRLRTTGGRYLLQTHHIEINPRAFELYGTNEVEGIVKHELCHYHLHIEGRGYKHRDQDFRTLLREVNAPRFCSNLYPQVSQKERTRILHTYMCVRCSHKYVRKIRINLKKYCCSKCLSPLRKIE
ncbi:MAG: SprT family protein [Lysinibacillus sp.]